MPGPVHDPTPGPQPAPRVWLSNPEPLHHEHYPDSARTITVELSAIAPRIVTIGWIFFTDHDPDEPGPFEVHRLDGSPYGHYGSEAAAERGAREFARRFLALPDDPRRRTREVIGPAGPNICPTCGREL